MIAPNNYFFGGEDIRQREVLSGFVRGFLSEVFPLKIGDWKTYEVIKNKFLKKSCSSPAEYEQACRCLADRLNI